MKKQNLTLAGVPAILYGERSHKVYLYVHGKNGCKEEAERFANTACAAGWQVLAIDLPEHGARKDRPEQLLPWAVVPEIQAVYARMQPVWPHIRLYGVSIGAWLAMQALRTEKLEKALFVSPVVDMETLILSMMQGAHVTEEQLKAAGEIPTEMGETNLFDVLGIEDDINAALSRKVWLKSGAYLVIDQTEALVDRKSVV